MKRIYLGLLIFTGLIGSAQNVNQFPIPTKQQLAWHETEYYLFLSYIRDRDYNAALAIMEKIKNDPGHIYHKKVTSKLIRQVKLLRWR